MDNIFFFTEDIDFTLNNKLKLRRWIESTIQEYNKKIINLNYIFTSDDYLLKINQQYLNHNTYTDIITFDQSNDQNEVEADIYISIDRVKENAMKLESGFIDELHRVMIHGVLHLLGYGDKSAAQKEEMRKKENHYLALRV
jgi:rRNA maturation RNase YbeY